MGHYGSCIQMVYEMGIGSPHSIGHGTLIESRPDYNVYHTNTGHVSLVCSGPEP